MPVHTPEEAEIARLRRTLTLWTIAVYIVACIITLVRVVAINDGHFVFALDDPYIHLALSEQIAHGTYGINPGEASSPSSSLLWPLLLVPFARASWQALVPLFLNFIAGLAAATLLARLVAMWPGDRSRWNTVGRFASAGLLIFAANLVVLTFIGMEHTLQVLLAAVCAYGVLRCVHNQPVPTWVLIGVALGPSVRYEAVGLTFLLVFALAVRGRYRAAALLGAGAITPLLLFSLFLHHLGLPILPLSVLVKGQQLASGGSIAHRVLDIARMAYHGIRSEPQRALLFVLTMTVAALALTQRDLRARWITLFAAGVLAMHLLVGRFGWFHRYEVYIVLFGVLIALDMLHSRWKVPALLSICILLIAGRDYLRATPQIARASHEIYMQPYQTHRFVDAFYRGNIALNDMGLVSYRRPPSVRIVDLWGLASLEASRHPEKSPAWLDEITRREHTDLVVITRSWYPGVAPSWIPLGGLCMASSQDMLIASDACASYYATSPAAAIQLSAQLQQFALTLPASVVWRPAQHAR